MKRLAILLSALLVGAAAVTAEAAGYLGRRAEKLPELRIGIGEDGYGMEPKEYRLETGKGYRLPISATGLVNCTLVMRDFLDNVWIRRLQAGDVEFKVPTISSIALDDEGEFELIFVPVRPGRYKWACRDLERQGLVGTFIVK